MHFKKSEYNFLTYNDTESYMKYSKCVFKYSQQEHPIVCDNKC